MGRFTLLLAALGLISGNEVFASERVRKIAIEPDQIATVRTALGIATIIQVPDRPSSVVVGDQGSFKVEYLDQAITIKPLGMGAKSNLYIYTDWRRYNVQLISGSESSADYVVYLVNPRKQRTPESKRNDHSHNKIEWKEFSASLVNEDLNLIITRLGRLKGSFLVVEFRIQSKKKSNFDPASIWVTQFKKTKPIEALTVSKFEVNPKSPIEGSLTILEKDVSMVHPFTLEVHGKSKTTLILPRGEKWN